MAWICCSIAVGIIAYHALTERSYQTQAASVITHYRSLAADTRTSLTNYFAETCRPNFISMVVSTGAPFDEPFEHEMYRRYQIEPGSMPFRKCFIAFALVTAIRDAVNPTFTNPNMHASEISRIELRSNFIDVFNMRYVQEHLNAPTYILSVPDEPDEYRFYAAYSEAIGSIRQVNQIISQINEWDRHPFAIQILGGTYNLLIISIVCLIAPWRLGKSVASIRHSRTHRRRPNAT